MVDIIVGLIIIGIASISIWKYRSEKKKGAKCVGCPYSPTTGDGKGCNCG